MNARTLTALVAASALLLSGCGADEPGEPTTGGSEPTNGQPTVDVGTESNAPEVTAPTVSRPISSLDRYKQDPCKILTRSQIEQLGYNNTVKRDLNWDNGPHCDWRDKETNSVAITVLNDQPQGLTGIYSNKDSFEYFEPTEVAGYPALVAGLIDNRDNGACAMDVGVTDEQVITLTASMLPGTPDAKRPCEVLKRAAKMAVNTMSAGK